LAIAAWAGGLLALTTWSNTDAAGAVAFVSTILVGVVVGRWWLLLVPVAPALMLMAGAHGDYGLALGGVLRGLACEGRAPCAGNEAVVPHNLAYVPFVDGPSCNLPNDGSPRAQSNRVKPSELAAAPRAWEVVVG
jgi:hypothetical protein